MDVTRHNATYATTVLQWNCNGIRAHMEDLKLLIAENNPEYICLQETKQNEQQYQIDKNYKTYNEIAMGDHSNKGGISIAIKKNIPHEKINLRTTLHAIALKVHTRKFKSICNIYLPPSETFQTDDLTEVFAQLPTPCIVVGDMNAHSPMWHDPRQDNRGRKIEKFLDDNNLTCLNTSGPTYFRTFDQASSSVDLALITSNKAADYRWEISEELHGSDHFPITITEEGDKHPPTRTPKWKIEKADWLEFRDKMVPPPEIESFTSTDEANEYLTKPIIDAAQQPIPRTSPIHKHKPEVPWWNKKCSTERKIVRNAYGKMHIHPNVINIKTYRRRQAI